MKQKLTLDQHIEKANAALTREALKFRKAINEFKIVDSPLGKIITNIPELQKETKTMSAENRKKSNKPELEKLHESQKRDKNVSQKTGKIDQKTGQVRRKVGTNRDLSKKQTLTKDASVTIKLRTVKIKPAA